MSANRDRRQALAATALSIAAIAAISGCCRDGVRIEERVLPKEQWIGMLDGWFGTLSIRLNNYTPVDHEFHPEDELAFHVPNDSSLSVSGVPVTMFDIPVERRDPYSFYVNDINSTAITPDTRNRFAMVTVTLEGDGEEIVGNCVDNVLCICGEPRIDLDDIVLELFLSLSASEGRLVIDGVQTSISSTFSETGPCVDNVCAVGCGLFAPDRESTAREIVETRVSSFVDMNRGLLEAAFNAHLQSLGVTEEITSVTVLPNGDLSLLLRSADPTCE
jgi:hypothetical protein